MNDRENPPDKDELQEIYDSLSVALPNGVEANMSDANGASTRSVFMKHFQSKASGEEGILYSQNQPKVDESTLTHTPLAMVV